jgi:two-component system sensor kinase FixL
MSVFPFKGHKGGVIVAHTDITARKLAEEKARKRRKELIHMGRITILGELAASIAHELNQPLTGILSNAQAGEMLLKQGDGNSAEIEEILTDIIADGKRSGDILRNLRDLFRKQRTEFEPLNVNGVVQETLRILHSEFVIQGLTIHQDLTDTLSDVMGNKVQLQQVLINLFRNANQAMQQSAKEDRSISVITSRGNESEVQVQVEDSGPGIDPEQLEVIFDPLTTLNPDGLGMGLSISRSIVHAHGGRIWAENKPSGGARICFTLPAAEVQS